MGTAVLRGEGAGASCHSEAVGGFVGMLYSFGEKQGVICTRIIRGRSERAHVQDGLPEGLGLLALGVGGGFWAVGIAEV